jgi:hypothetical protein
MLGDTLREAAVLFLVFIPLDVALGIAEKQLSVSGIQIILVVSGTVLASALLEWFGMELEHWR